MVEFDIKLTLQDMYRFNIYQIYSGVHGWVSIFVAILLWVAAVGTHGEVTMTYTILYIVFGFIFLFYLPLSLYMRAKHSLAVSQELRDALHYAVGETGFKVSQGEASAELKWEQIYKMVATKHNVLVYSNRINAYVIPRNQLGELYTPLAELANAKLEKHRVKMH